MQPPRQILLVANDALNNLAKEGVWNLDWSSALFQERNLLCETLQVWPQSLFQLLSFPCSFK